MTIYKFFSGGTIFLTTSRSLKNAKEIGQDVYERYLDNCKYLGEKPDEHADGSYFIPNEVEAISKSEFIRFAKTDPDIVILDERLRHIDPPNVFW